jgi:hypothetical protein
MTVSTALRLFLCLLALISVVGVQSASASIPGSIQTTLADGTTVNANIMPSKQAAYLNGGPQNESSAGLPTGTYYFQVTDPSGTVLLSTDDVTCRQVVVVPGTSGKGVIHGNPGGTAPASCTEPAGSLTPGAFHNNGGTDAANGGSIPIQLCAPTGCPAGSSDYLDTPNGGGEYKVWLISVADYNACGAAPSKKNNFCFENGNTKTDNFKVRATANVQAALVEVCKFDDTNANGVQDNGEPFIPHWPITATGVDPSSGNPTADGTTVSTQTGDNGCVAFTYTGGVANHTITLTEGLPSGWTATAPASGDCTAALTGAVVNPADTCSVSYSGGIPTITITVNQGDLINAPNFGNNNCGGPCTNPTLVVTKSANPSLTRTFTWGISKSVDQTKINTSGSATFNYTVSVTHDAGTDSNWQVTGVIRVGNPGTSDISGITVADTVDDGGSCTVDTTGFSGTVAAGTHFDLPYTCAYGSLPPAGTNTATASFDSSQFSGTAPIDFTTAAINAVDDCVDVTDTLGGNLGTVCSSDTSPKTFTYSKTFTDPAGTCTSHDNTATFTSTTSPTTGNSNTVTVTDCVGADLTVTKTATPTFNSNISKSPNQTEFDTSSGSNVTITYTVTVTESGWQVAGNITVNNPNDWEDITANLSDAITGASCTVNGGTTSVLVNRSSSVQVPYTCTFSSAPSSASGTNTATASWTGASTPDTSANGSANYTFGTLTVTDAFNGGGAATLGTITTPAASSTFTDPHTVTAPTATCTTFNNTAAITETSQNASASVKVCGASDLNVSKTATPAFNSNITKTADKAEYDAPSGSSVPISYTVTVTESGWKVTGTITVTNPNDWEDITTTNLTDALTDGTATCTITGGATQTVPKSSFISPTYSCTFSGTPGSSSGTNTATASWDATATHTADGTASGTASYTFGKLTVTDSFNSGASVTLGTISTPTATTTFPVPETVTAPTASCGTFPNVATISETSQSANASTQVCGASDLTVSKTATPAYNSNITKTADKAEYDAPSGSSVPISYTVTVTESGWNVSGNITVNNPNSWEAITASVADSLPTANCSVSPTTSQSVPASGSATWTYKCTFNSAPSATGTNSATANWNSTTAHTADGSASGSAGYTFAALTVTDAFNNGGSVTLGTITNPAATSTFSVPETVTAPTGICATFPNTATAGSNSATANAKVCGASPLTVIKDANPSFNSNITKTASPASPSEKAGSTTFTYTITVTENTWKVTGNVSVTNPNTWESIALTGVTDTLTGATCSVSPATIPASSTVNLPYSCSFSLAPAATGTNYVTITWNAATAFTSVGSASANKSYAFAPLTVTDTFGSGSPATLGTISVPAASTKFTDTKTLSPVGGTCQSVSNTATISPLGQIAPGSTTSAGVTVTACNTATGALTMGFWKNKNGQAIISGGASTSGVCKSGTWLRQFAPFQDLSATATCSQVATYVSNVLSSASAGGAAMNAMLKGQMLATALDVYFSDPTLGGNQIGAPTPLGGVKIDLTHVCQMIDSSGGTGTCSGNFENAGPAFGGATSDLVSVLLTFAASQSNSGGSTWYGQNKTIQGLAKDTFDEINNQVATIAP